MKTAPISPRNLFGPYSLVWSDLGSTNISRKVTSHELPTNGLNDSMGENVPRPLKCMTNTSECYGTWGQFLSSNLLETRSLLEIPLLPSFLPCILPSFLLSFLPSFLPSVPLRSVELRSIQFFPSPLPSSTAPARSQRAHAHPEQRDGSRTQASSLYHCSA